MVMSFDWKPLWSLFKRNRYSLLFKFSVSILVMGLAFCLYYSNDSTGLLLVIETPFVQTITMGEVLAPPVPVKALAPAPAPMPVKALAPAPAPAPVPDKALAPAPAPVPEKNADSVSQKGKCDLSIGDWIPDPSGPFYTNESCNHIYTHQNCMTNGRPDSGYLYWRWNPRDCELPRFNAVRFLEIMRNKSWAIIGDSIARNHVQSLLCILSQVEAAELVYHEEGWGSMRWQFPSYNFNLSVIWSPFLLKPVKEVNGLSSDDIHLHIDELDKKWTDHYQSFDYVIISCGQWFLRTTTYYENNTIIGCNSCPGKNLTEFGNEFAYRRALKEAFNFIVTSNHSSVVLLRTFTPQHFENAAWNRGGTCERTVPFKEGEISLHDIDNKFHNIELEEFEKAKTLGAEKRIQLKLLDTTHLSLLRPDGHPGPYRHFHPFAKDKNAKVQNDCLHWCLPGPIDSWNDLILEMVMDD